MPPITQASGRWLGRPGFCGLEIPTKPTESILAAQPALVHAGDFGYRLVILQTATMGEPGAADQTVERERFEDVGHGRGIVAGARQGVVCGKLGDGTATFHKVIPRHQSAIRGERLVTAAQVKLPARRQEFEIQFSFTRWVNQLCVGFRLQAPLR